MSPDRVREMVAAMQAAGEDDDAIEAALTLASAKPANAAPVGKVLDMPADQPWYKKLGSAIAEPFTKLGHPFTDGAGPTATQTERSPELGALLNQQGIDSFLSQNNAGPGTPEYAAMQAENKLKNAAGGMMVGGGVGTMAMRGLGPLVSTALGRIAAGTLSSAAGGSAGAGSEAAMNDEPVIPAMKAGGAFGALAGAPLSAVGEIPAMLRRTQSVGPYLKAKDAGVYEKPEMKALSPGPEGMQEASEAAVGKITAREQQLRSAAEKEWNLVGKDKAVLEKPVNASVIKDKLVEGQLKHIDPDTGMPADGSESIVSAYQRAIDKTAEKATVQGVLKRRQSLKKAAAFDNPSPTPEQLAARDVYMTLREAVRDASPEVAAADDAYAAFEKSAGNRSDLIGVKDAGNMSVAERERAAATVGRLGDKNVAGIRKQSRLEELRGSDPGVGEAMDIIAAKKAQENVRPGMPNMPTHLSAATLIGGIPRAIGQNTRALAAHVVDPMTSLFSMPRASLVGAEAAQAVPASLQEFQQQYREALARLEARRQQENRP